MPGKKKHGIPASARKSKEIQRFDSPPRHGEKQNNIGFRIQEMLKKRRSFKEDNGSHLL
jgi:hypothetical protein